MDTTVTRALRALVRGRVQGVRFREFARRKGLALGLTGYAKNLPDGQSVEVYAEGDEESLKAFFAGLHSGPAFSRVDRIDETWEQPRGEFEDFSIIW